MAKNNINLKRGQSVYDGTPCKVYDIETKTVLGEFESYSAASMFLGITPIHVGVSIRGKHKTFAPFINKKVAIRNNWPKQNQL